MKLQLVAALTSLASVSGVRISRSKQQVKHLAGVKVHDYRDGVNDWILLFKKGTSEATIQQTCAGQCKVMGHPTKGGLAFATVKGTEKLEELLLKHGENVELLEQDQEDYAIPDMLEQDRDLAATASSNWNLERIGVSRRPTTGQGVHIYLQDSGVRASHNEFGGRVVPTLDFTTGNDAGEECGPSPTTCSQDQDGHGSHCAGLAAGATYGVASSAVVHAVKTLNVGGEGQRSWNIAGIDWATSYGERPTVISMSLGGFGTDPAYEAVIDAATVAGVTVVVAAGNFGYDACMFAPAHVGNAITVGSTTSNDARSGFSNYGSCTNIWAPGSQIMSASWNSDTATEKKSGTSMACPEVAGAAALILEANPTFLRDDVAEALLSSAIEGEIGDLREGDTNKLLYVGEGGAPPAAPTPAPWTPPPPLPGQCPSFARGPDYAGDCKCITGRCSVDGGATFLCPTSDVPGAWRGVWFSVGCTECECGY